MRCVVINYYCLLLLADNFANQLLAEFEQRRCPESDRDGAGEADEGFVWAAGRQEDYRLH